MSTGVYNKVAGDIAREALRAATITGSAMPVEDQDFANAMTAINDVLAFWQTQGIHLWSETEAVLPLNKNQQSYNLGVGGDHCFTDYIYTRSLAATAAVNIITVDSTDRMVVGQNLGIELSTGFRQWTTIQSVADAVTLVLADPLDASVNQYSGVYVYSNLIDQPIRILSARYSNRWQNYRIDYSDYNETPVELVSRKEYYETPMKGTEGSADIAYYSRQLNMGVLSVWPVANNGQGELRFTFLKPQYIPEDQSENILVPPEWYLPLKWAVAVELGTIYVIDKERQAMNEIKAERFIEAALSVDVEVASFYVQPDC